MKVPYKAHPWHGVDSGKEAPEVVNAYIEIVPTDTVKYEIDKETGHLKVDRPQKFSNYCPALYGFVPRTYCGNAIGDFCAKRTHRKKIEGDGDPLDICVLTEKAITHGDILVQAVPIGGFRIVDRGQADDKIIAVLHEDAVYGSWSSVHDCPPKIIERLRHYFLTYKDLPGTENRKVEISDVYDFAEARKVIELSIKDYRTLIAKKRR
ncbi:MAG: inorganic pyrophosphatase [Deltaproteobacteria bacterium]|nr:inorganic pyrophosphatase [Deltaproteobacteria bacterium]